MGKDLFGRTIFESTPAMQPALFDDRHWFGIGYEDAQSGQYRSPQARGAGMHFDAYVHGWNAGRRDKAAGVYYPERAWEANRAVGNVEGKP